MSGGFFELADVYNELMFLCEGCGQPMEDGSFTVLECGAFFHADCYTNHVLPTTLCVCNNEMSTHTSIIRLHSLAPTLNLFDALHVVQTSTVPQQQPPPKPQQQQQPVSLCDIDAVYTRLLDAVEYDLMANTVIQQWENDCRELGRQLSNAQATVAKYKQQITTTKRRAHQQRAEKEKIRAKLEQGWPSVQQAHDELQPLSSGPPVQLVDDDDGDDDEDVVLADRLRGGGMLREEELRVGAGDGPRRGRVRHRRHRNPIILPTPEQQERMNAAETDVRSLWKTLWTERTEAEAAKADMAKHADASKEKKGLEKLEQVVVDQTAKYQKLAREVKEMEKELAIAEEHEAQLERARLQQQQQQQQQQQHEDERQTHSHQHYQQQPQPPPPPLSLSSTLRLPQRSFSMPSSLAQAGAAAARSASATKQATQQPNTGLKRRRSMFASSASGGTPLALRPTNKRILLPSQVADKMKKAGLDGMNGVKVKPSRPTPFNKALKRYN